MKLFSRTCLWLLVFPLAFSSCSKQEQKQTDLVTFPLKGEVVEIDTAARRLMVAHEEIPDYMMAMTMPFKVKNPALLKGLEVGDSIAATLAVSLTESWLETITVIGKGEVPDPLVVAGAIAARMLKPGDKMPPGTYLNQDGKQTSFAAFTGKVVAITFIYSRCPLPDYCILMSNNFGKVQKQLKADAALTGKWHLVTVSFDPEFDSPKVLKEYGQSYKADFATWDFLTDPDTTGKTVMALADGFGLTYEDDEGGLIAHNLRTVILDAGGEIVKVFQGNEWTAGEVVTEMKKQIAASL